MKDDLQLGIRMLFKPLTIFLALQIDDKINNF